MTKNVDSLIAKMVTMTKERNELLSTGTKSDYDKAMDIDAVIVDHIYDDLDTSGYNKYSELCKTL